MPLGLFLAGLESVCRGTQTPLCLQCRNVISTVALFGPFRACRPLSAHFPETSALCLLESSVLRRTDCFISCLLRELSLALRGLDHSTGFLPRVLILPPYLSHLPPQAC